jgi:hypothetical protein
VSNAKRALDHTSQSQQDAPGSRRWLRITRDSPIP